MGKGTRLWSLFTGVALAVGLNAAIGAEVLRQPTMDVLPLAEVVGEGANLQIRVKAVKTDFGGWGYMRDVTTGRAVDPPASPLPDEGASAETIGLVPMGCAQVRIVLFPWMEKEDMPK